MKSSLGDVGKILELRQSFADRLRNFKTYENLQEPLKTVGFTHRVELNPMVTPPSGSNEKNQSTSNQFTPRSN